MLVSTVEKVKEIDKNGKNMYLVTIEGENYMCFDSKWKDTAGNVVKYDKIPAGKYTNLKFIEVIGKKEGFEFEEEKKGSPSVNKGPVVPVNKYMALNAVNAASIAFIRSGVITDPDAWLAFVKQGIIAYEDFLDEELVPKESSENT
jgi:hypothetical protein